MKTAFNKTFFGDFTKDELNELSQISSEISINAGTVFVKEGSFADSLFIILQGEVDVIKHYQDDESYVIATLQVGEWLGDATLFSQQKRLTDLQAKTDIKLLSINITQLKQTDKLYSKIIKKTHSTLASKLSNTNELTVAAINNELKLSRTKLAMGSFIIAALMIVALYTITLNFTKYLVVDIAYLPILSFSYIFVFSVALLIVVKSYKYPLRDFGFSLQKWPKNLLQAILFTAPIVIVGILIKLILIHTDLPSFSGQQLFDLGKVKILFGDVYVLDIVLYIVGVPLQEVFARGCLQGSLQMFLTPSHKNTFRAIVASNLIFAAAHTHLAKPMLLTSTFIVGIGWGYLYAYQKSLVGVIASHLILGIFAIFILAI